MVFNIGDHVIYEDNDGGCLIGEIVDIWRDKREIISSYFVVTDSGLYVQFMPHNRKWSKLEEPVLIS